MTTAVDVAIVGGGLVGASLALALRDSPFKVALIELAAPPAAEPDWDERCIGINAASQKIFAALGVWDALAREAEPILATHVSERGRFGVARFTAQEAGLPALGHNIPLRALSQTLWQAVQQTRTQIFCPARIEGLEVLPGAVNLQLSTTSLSAKLVIAADGAQSAVRRLLGVEAVTEDYGQSALVTAVRPARAHQGCAYERFTPEGPIALLPKPVLSGVEGPGNACSLVWTLPTARCTEMLALDPRAFLGAAQDAFGERLGLFRELGRRQAYPLARVMSQQLTTARVLFAGNAAQALHPVAAQGFNLGLRDAATAAEILATATATATDPGAEEVLQRYAEARRRDREVTAGFTDRLVRVFSNRVPVLSDLRHLGLLALDLLPPVKQAVMWQNLGYTAAPQSARAVFPSPSAGEGRERGRQP